MSHIRIESHEKVVRNAKVFFVDGDEEVDISHCVQVVDLHLGVGEAATATLQTIVGHAAVTAQVEDIVVNRVKPRTWWRRRWYDVTAVSDRTRRVV
jgi:hypothetical protein